MRAPLFKVCPLTLLLLFNMQARGAEPYEYARSVFQCQQPMLLDDFPGHMRQGQGHKAIHWDFRALMLSRPTGSRIVQLSQDTVSPGGSLTIEGAASMPMKPMTLERKWLETLRGTEAVNLLSKERQLILWINESYHLFALEEEDLLISETNPIYPAVKNGAFVFTGEKVAFIVGKDQQHFMICPKLDAEEAPGDLNRRQLTAEVMQFMQDPKIRQFFDCEALLISKKI